MLATSPIPSDALGQRNGQQTQTPASLEAFLAGISVRAFRFAEAGLHHREDALDAVQDAMIRMLSYADRPATEWAALFWSILRRRIIDLQRRANFLLRWMRPASDRGNSELVDWADESGLGPLESRQHQQTWQRLAQALRRLPARQREALTLRVLEELDLTTTAHIMGCSQGSVKTHLARARKTLKKHMGDLV